MLALARAAVSAALLRCSEPSNAPGQLAPLPPTATLPLQLRKYAFSSDDARRRQACRVVPILVPRVVLRSTLAQYVTRARKRRGR